MLKGDCTIWGKGWDESFQNLNLNEGVNISLTHEMILPTKEGLFPGHDDFETKRGVMKKYPGIDIIISGDNHTPHVWQNKKGQIQLNCGSIPRKNKDQTEYQPAIWEICVEKGNCTYTEVPIPIAPTKEVFDFDRIEKEEHREDLKAYIHEFITSLSTQTNTPNFEKNIQSTIKEANPNKEVRHIIAATLEEVK